jgi:TonB family protein
MGRFHSRGRIWFFSVLTVSLLASASVAADAASSPAQSLTGVVPPKVAGVHSASAFYPEISRRLNQEGTVVVSYTILADGSVSNPSVITSSGFSDLDNAALVAVKTWRYTPASKDGVAVAVPWQTAVQFKLTDPEGVNVAPYLAANVIDMIATDVPPESRTAHEGGDTWIVVTIGETGTVTGAVLVRSSGYPRLDQAATAIAVTRWRFACAMMDGQPMKSMLLIDARWPPA